MPARTQQNITVYCRETRAIEMTVVDEDGAEVDLQGEHVTYRIAKNPRTTATNCLVAVDENDPRITVNDSGSGTFSVVRYDPGRDDLQPAGKYVHELRVTQSGSDARVVMTGIVEILPSITD